MVSMILVNEINIVSETGNDLVLKYFIKSKTDNIDKKDNIFGISVEKNECGATEYEDTGWITKKIDMAQNIINVLIKNTVTPVNLLYIVDDIFSCLQITDL